MPNLSSQAFLASARADPAATLIALDIDGTVSEIAASPAEAIIDDELRLTLTKLAGRYHLWYISGRDADQARHMVGVEMAGYIGAHGLEVLDSDTLRPLSSAFPSAAAFERIVRGVTADVPEALTYVEYKRWSVAFHYRAFLESDELVGKLRRSIETHITPGLQLLPGKAVFEVRLDANYDKGTALRWLIDRFAPRHVLVAGDDVTDIAMFRALADIPGLAGLRIAIQTEEAPTVLLTDADLVLDGVCELHRFLRALLS